MASLQCLVVFLLASVRSQGLPFTFEFSNKLHHVAPVKGYWSLWNYWTACSRSCGGGVTFRTRYCLHSNAMIDLSNCEGPSREYNLCNTEPCPSGSPNFRAMQCSMYDELDYYGVVRHWTPLTTDAANGECNLLCERNVDASNIITRNLGVVVDGTECNINDGRGVCIKGQCRSVGCDTRLDSPLRYDTCGECGGTNNSCGLFTGTFNTEIAEDELFHYHDVVTLQPGTANITVEERSDVNYLALSVNNRFYLNGNWEIHSPGTFTAAGALFTYQRRRDGYELLTTPGPVNALVQILVIVRTQHPTVTYRFHVPPMRYQPSKFLPQLGNSILTNTAVVDESNNGAFVPVTEETDIEKDDHNVDLKESWKKSDKNGRSESKVKKRKLEPRKQKTKKNQPSKKVAKELCGPCTRVKGKVRNFCYSDFVVHAMILDRVVETNMTRFDVQIMRTFTNNVMLYSREYIWVPNICNCPRMKVGREYLIMGDRVQSTNSRENLLMVDRNKMVIRWKEDKFALWDSIQSTSNTKCHKMLKKARKKSRVDH